MPINYQSLLGSLLPAVYEAGDAIMAIHAKGAEAEYKGDGSPVTLADKLAEKILLKALNVAAPDITIISEENKQSHRLKAPDRFFLVDPLDGTKEFLKADGKGAFTVNIGLIENQTPVWGIVFAPALGRLFTGSRDHGAHEIVDGTTKEISARAIPPSGPTAVASVSHRDVQTDKWLKTHNITKTVSIGSSLKFCLLAAGEADLYPRFSPTMEWDTAAGDAVLRSAGGSMINPDNTPFLYGKGGYRNGSFIARGRL